MWALGKHPLVLTALDEDEVGPGAAPALEQPTQDVRPTGCCRGSTTIRGWCRWPWCRTVGRPGARGTTPWACGSGRSRNADAARTATTSRRSHVGQRELPPDGNDLHREALGRVLVRVAGHDTPRDLVERPQLVGQQAAGPSWTSSRPGTLAGRRSSRRAVPLRPHPSPSGRPVSALTASRFETYPAYSTKREGVRTEGAYLETAVAHGGTMCGIAGFWDRRPGTHAAELTTGSSR